MPRQTQFRFPGRVELRYGHALPNVGERFASQGDEWVVTAVTTEDEVVVCLLELVESDDAGRRQPEEVG